MTSLLARINGTDQRISTLGGGTTVPFMGAPRAQFPGSRTASAAISWCRTVILALAMAALLVLSANGASAQTVNNRCDLVESWGPQQYFCYGVSDGSAFQRGLWLGAMHTPMSPEHHRVDYYYWDGTTWVHYDFGFHETGQQGAGTTGTTNDYAARLEAWTQCKHNYNLLVWAQAAGSYVVDQCGPVPSR